MSHLHLPVQSTGAALGNRGIAQMRKEDRIRWNQARPAPAELDPPLVRRRFGPRSRRFGADQTLRRPPPRIHQQSALDLLRATVAPAQELHAGNPQSSPASRASLASGMSSKWLYITARGRQDRETGYFRAPIEGRRVGPTEAEP